MISSTACHTFSERFLVCAEWERSSESRKNLYQFTLSQSFSFQNFLFPYSMVSKFLSLERSVLQVVLILTFLRTGQESCVLN